MIGALVGGGAVAAWYWRRSQQAAPLDAASNPDVNLDIGGAVHVAHWRADGSARVQYRGAGWDVRYTGSDAPSPGDFVIQAVEGNRLLLGHR